MKKLKLRLSSNNAGNSTMQKGTSISVKHANSSPIGDSKNNKYTQPSTGERRKPNCNPDQKEHTNTHNNVDASALNESNMRLQKQFNDADDQPIIKGAKRKYAVRYVKAESIPTCATSILNIQTWRLRMI